MIDMRAVSFQSRGVRIQGWRTGEGTRVLSTHGWLDNANTWKPVAERCPRADWCSIDFPGHGLSGHLPQGQSYHFVDNVEVLMDAAEALGWERFSLVGHSMGGSMAMMFAAAFPERVEKLVLSDSFGPLTGVPEDTATQIRSGMLSRRSSRQTAQKFYPHKQELIDRMLRGNSSLSLDAIETLAQRNFVHDPEKGWAFGYDRRCRDVSPYRYTLEQVQALIQSLPCPTLFIRASESFVTRFGSLEEIIREKPNFRLVEVNGGHHVHLVSPEGVAPEIQRFLLS